MTDDSESVDILPLLDELRVIGQNGLMYAETPYDRERNERLLELASEYYGKAIELPPEKIRERLAGEVGYATAKAGAGATVFNDDSEVLLVKRADNGKWGFPAGAVEPNESAADAAVRETKEETGIDVRVTELQGVYHHGTDAPSAHTVTHVHYRCERIWRDIAAVARDGGRAVLAYRGCPRLAPGRCTRNGGGCAQAAVGRQRRRLTSDPSSARRMTSRIGTPVFSATAAASSYSVLTS